MRMRFVAVVALALAFCAPASAAQFSFGVFGDMPYNAAEEFQLSAIIEEMSAEDLAFAMHVGDLKSAASECTDRLLAQRRKTFSMSKHAFVYLPGDNDWADCTRSATAPLEWLAKLRELFFARDSTLGQRPLRVERQSARGYPEHLRWTLEGVLFATLNVPGHDNNRARMPKESQQRTAAVIEWMKDAFRIARERKLPAVVLALHADMFWRTAAAYADIVAVLANEARGYAGQVLIVHGDTHWFRFDQPLTDAAGKPVENVTRVEVFGSPLVDWTRVTVLVENGRASFAAVSGRQPRGAAAGAER